MGKFALLIGLCLCLTFSTNAYAGQSEDWKFTLSPFFWGACLNGTSTSGEDQSSIDLTFKDIWDNLDIAAMVDLRAEKGPLAMASNIVYCNIEDTSHSELFKTDVEAKLWIAEATGQHRLGDNWEVLAGIRYYDVEVELNVKDKLTGQVIGGSGSEDWIDPIVGLVYERPLNDRLSFLARADIGGGLGGSNLSWQLWGLFDYRIGEENSVVMGWRHLKWDYTTGSGDSMFGLDAYMDGPVAGVRFVF